MDKYKVKLIYYDFEGEIAVESVWVDKIGNYYQIKNIPFFAPNIAYDDIISIEEDNGELFFDEIKIPSGNATIQIILFDYSCKEKVLNQLEELGCGWEGFKNKEYYAINIPLNIDLSKIISFLDNENHKKILDYRISCDRVM